MGMLLIKVLDALSLKSNGQLAFILVMSFLLSACGASGGSGDDSSTESIVNAENQNPDEGEPTSEPEVTPVTISSQPQALTVEAGNNANFSISASGGGSLSFQWRKGGQNIVGATANTLTLANVTAADAGLYSVVVGNSVSSEPSFTARLTVTTPVVIVEPVDQPVVIISQPQALMVEENAAARFSVQVTGDGEIDYQWLKNGSVIEGATTSTLNIISATIADAANYSVVVTNSQGPVFSEGVALSVTAVQLASSIELTWDLPQEREDGSALELYEINGYVIAYGADENNLSNQLTVDGGQVQSTVLENLAAGIYYFSIATVDSDGVQGAYSGVIQQSI